MAVGQTRWREQHAGTAGWKHGLRPGRAARRVRQEARCPSRAGPWSSAQTLASLTSLLPAALSPRTLQPLAACPHVQVSGSRAGEGRGRCAETKKCGLGRAESGLEKRGEHGRRGQRGGQPAAGRSSKPPGQRLCADEEKAAAAAMASEGIRRTLKTRPRTRGLGSSGKGRKQRPEEEEGPWLRCLGPSPAPLGAAGPRPLQPARPPVGAPRQPRGTLGRAALETIYSHRSCSSCTIVSMELLKIDPCPNLRQGMGPGGQYTASSQWVCSDTGLGHTGR